jgi:hypothetical protein
LIAQGRLTQIKHCVHCMRLNVEQSTVAHYLTSCTQGAEVARDTERHNALSE